MTILLANSDLINGFRNGDELADQQLYNLHYRPLCYFAERLIGDKEEAEDIAVESFIKVLKKRSDFDTMPAIKSFLFTAVRNACFDYLRKSKTKNRTARELSYLAEPDEQFGDHELVTAKVLQVIYAEIENLPRQCKVVFKSIFIEEKSTATIAAEMGISPQTVLNQKTKALQIIRMKLLQEGLYTLTIWISCLLMIAGNRH